MKPRLLLLVVLLTLSCQKDEIKIEPSPSIFGEWEIRSVINLFDYGDYDYHNLEEPYAIYRFKEDSTFEQTYDQVIFNSGQYSIDLIDSSIYLKNSRWNLLFYSDTLMTLQTSELDTYRERRLHKVE